MMMCIGTFLVMASNLATAENYAPQSTMQQSDMAQDSATITVKVASDPKLGRILTDGKGMTLYMFTPDKNNTSACYDQCAVTWPPLLVSSGTPSLAQGVPGTLGTIKRRDNTTQVTFNGMPLYYFVKDKKPGDVYGQNVDNKWFVVNPK